MDDIAATRQGDLYFWGTFWLFPDPSRGTDRYGWTDLPSGIDRIYGKCYVLGRSLVALVLTFAPTAGEATRIDAALHDDEVERERIDDARGEVTRRCLETQAEYMELLDLSEPSLAEKFREIASLMVADSLKAALLSFGPRLRDIRAGLNRLDIEKPAGTQVVELRDHLLGLSREVSAVFGDVTLLVDNDIGDWIWSAFSPLTRVNPDGGFPAAPQTTADIKQQQLRAAIATLQAQEAGLRDLILVISQSMSDARNLELQTRVLDLTDGLNRLTKWLIFLTIVLVVLGVATLVIQSFSV